MPDRIIESERLKIKLLNGSVIDIRPLTLAERKECLSILPQKFSGKTEKFVEQYMKVQGDIMFYIIKRSNKDFKREDINTELDSSLIERIVKFTLKDPFSEILGM